MGPSTTQWEIGSLFERCFRPTGDTLHTTNFYSAREGGESTLRRFAADRVSRRVDLHLIKFNYRAL